MSYLKRFTTTPAAQRDRLRADQIRNSEGGFVWEVDCWARLRRFLILGSENSSFYARERHLTASRATGIAARLIVVGMVANGFTIADPNDAGMLDVVGFDTSTPEVIGGFARGDL